MQLEYKKSAVDLTDLAIGIVVLGIVVSVGANVLINVRNTNTTSDTAYNLANSAAIGIAEYGNWWSESLSPLEEESFNAKSEYRLTSSNGQDRSVKHLNYALETDKEFQEGMIYSPSLCNI